MPSASALLKAIQHPKRRQILNYINENPSAVNYSNLLPFCDNSTGKLNYHIRILDDIIEKKDGGYVLSNKGEAILSWLNTMVDEEDFNDFDRPRVVFSRVYPEPQLMQKYILIIILIDMVVLLIPAFLLLYYLNFVPLFPIVLIATGFAIWLISMYCNSIWYQITDTEIIVHKGIITKTEKIVPYRTVTNIEVKRGIFDRLFDISSIEIHTAGSSKIGPEEGLVGLINGVEIKDTILERIRLLNPPNFAQSTGQPISTVNLKPIVDEIKDLNAKMRE
ncbi:MAG: PH domain-containing protein [Candidatus Hodarchaeales archaeon]